MSIANTYFDEAVAGLCRRIAEAEMRSTALANALAALTRTEGDTAEAEQRLKVRILSHERPLPILENRRNGRL